MGTKCGSVKCMPLTWVQCQGHELQNGKSSWAGLGLAQLLWKRAWTLRTLHGQYELLYVSADKAKNKTLYRTSEELRKRMDLDIVNGYLSEPKESWRTITRDLTMPETPGFSSHDLNRERKTRF